jgi:hypothetical protein
MANIDNPRGFFPVRHLTGGEIRQTSYTLTASQTVYQGDLLKVVAAGTVQASAADDGVIVVGVAAEYKVAAASGITKVSVYDDPYIVFGVQSDTGTDVELTDVFATANHVAGSGSATTKMSGHELDSDDIGTGAQLKIIGKEDVPGNDWGDAHVDLHVLINEHLYKAAVAGV